MTKPCALITTGESDDRLVQLLLNEDNSFGPMGSGGCDIKRDKNQPSEATCLTFVQMDCAPAPTYRAYIKDGKIWATHIKAFIMQTLSSNGIRFSHEETETPVFVFDHLKKAA